MLSTGEIIGIIIGISILITIIIYFMYPRFKIKYFRRPAPLEMSIQEINYPSSRLSHSTSSSRLSGIPRKSSQPSEIPRKSSQLMHDLGFEENYNPFASESPRKTSKTSAT